MISGDRTDGLAFVKIVDDPDVEECWGVNGERERRRIASVMVGWNSPPCSENLCRCVGSS